MTDGCPGQLLRGLEAHGLQIVPTGWIFGHRDAVLIAQDDASAVEDAPDRRVELARDLRLGSPNGAQDGRYVEGVISWTGQ